MSYRRRRFTYSYRAWINEEGSNVDRDHKIGWCGREEKCLRLWDLNTTKKSRNIIRVVRRKRPFYLRVAVGQRYRTVLKIGRGGDNPWMKF